MAPTSLAFLSFTKFVGALVAVIVAPIAIFVFLEVYSYHQMRMIGSKQLNIILPSVRDIMFL